MRGSVNTRIHTTSENFIRLVEVVDKKKNVNIHGGAKNSHNPQRKSSNQSVLKTFFLERRDNFFKNELEIHVGEPVTGKISLWPAGLIQPCWLGRNYHLESV